MYAQALEANGFNVETKLDLGSEQIADKALQNGQIDLYPEYTGTALVEVFKQSGTTGHSRSDLPGGQERLRRARPGEHDARRRRTSTTPTASSCAGRSPRSTTCRHSLTSPRPPRTSRSSRYSEFQNRSDGYPNMQKNYPALDFEDDQDREQLGVRSTRAYWRAARATSGWASPPTASSPPTSSW